MVGTLSRCLRGSQVLICCVLVLTTAWSAGCTRAVVGAADPMVSGRVAAPIAVPELLVEPARFPSQYAAAVLDSTAVYRARSFAGQAAVAVRFQHTSTGDSAAILGLTERNALELAMQLIQAVKGV